MPHTSILENTSTFYAFLFENVRSGNRDSSKLLAEECFSIWNISARKDISWISSTPFNHSCNNRGKDRVLPTFGPRSIFGAFQLRFDYRLVEGGVGSGLHLQLSKASPTESNQGPHLHKAKYSHPYLSISIPVYIQCQCKNLKLIS